MNGQGVHDADLRSPISNLGTSLPSCLTITRRTFLTGCCDWGIGKVQAWNSIRSASCSTVNGLDAFPLHPATSAEARTTIPNITMRFFIKCLATPDRILPQRVRFN